MPLNKLQDERGLTLLELSIAMAILAIVLVFAAQATVSFYATQDLQAQRNESLQNCLSLAAQMRVVRDANPENFPDAVVEAWPNGGTVEGAGTLPNETITVSYTDVNADPLEVTVVSMWDDLRGHRAQQQLTLVLTDR